MTIKKSNYRLIPLQGHKKQIRMCLDRIGVLEDRRYPALFFKIDPSLALNVVRRNLEITLLFRKPRKLTEPSVIY